jgi:hypothetical protein
MRVEGREWLRVEARTPEYVPTNEDDLVQHLEKVRARAQQLSDDVTSVLEKKPTWLSIEDHYSDEASFGLLQGVSKTDKQNEFVLITGSESHYLRKEPTVPACPFHDWQKGVSVGEQYPEAGPLSLPSINPRAFFATPGLHHCAHQQVHAAKSSPITEANRQHCGSRSGADNAAFCEIWPFEHHLCCRTCVFEDVCTKASVFHLPCKRLDGAHNGCHCGTSTSHLIAGEVKMPKQPSE